MFWVRAASELAENLRRLEPSNGEGLERNVVERRFSAAFDHKTVWASAPAATRAEARSQLKANAAINGRSFTGLQPLIILPGAPGSRAISTLTWALPARRESLRSIR